MQSPSAGDDRVADCPERSRLRSRERPLYHRILGTRQRATGPSIPTANLSAWSCYARLFTEGVDVPSLEAVAFLDPRDSQVDVVQAVGRVMRKAPGKRFGYIIIPVVVEPGRDVAAALERGTEGYRTVGLRVLRALQAHDGRLAESPANFIKVYEQTKAKAPGDPAGGTVRETGASTSNASWI